MVSRAGPTDARRMARLTFVFDPYSPRSAATASTLRELDLDFEGVHAGAWSSRLGLGPDSERSARAFCALRTVADERLVVHELHQALAIRDERLGRGVLTAIARRLGVDPALVFAQLRRHRDSARLELARGRALQLGDGPALLFEQDNIVTSLPLEAAALEPLIGALI